MDFVDAIAKVKTGQRMGPAEVTVKCPNSRNPKI